MIQVTHRQSIQGSAPLPTVTKFITSSFFFFFFHKPNLIFSEATMSKLMSSGGGTTNRYNEASNSDAYLHQLHLSLTRAPLGGACAVCRLSGRTAKVSCGYCERGACSSCARPCDGCGGVFCGTCSTINYDERMDRVFCLGCADAVSKSAGKRVGGAMTMMTTTTTTTTAPQSGSPPAFPSTSHQRMMIE